MHTMATDLKKNWRLQKFGDVQIKMTEAHS